ncbi:hypothetical protein I4U23_004577 [Adineta vaga]|nr:hypothetical protein I4U23_004577 [Adineta vaga]
MSHKMLFLCILLNISLTRATTITRAASPAVPPSVCYVDFGCFSPRPGFKLLPQSPQKINTQFFLFSRNQPFQSQVVSSSNLGSFDQKKPTKFIIHGFTDRASSSWVANMTKELLKQGDMNVITIDWSGGNQFPYGQAVANTVVVAAVIRQLLQAMINVGAKPQEMHLIGHSLGAHISSYVGRDLRNLGRISGLDPAGPDFYDSLIPDRLDSSDALFVDVIHTDGAPRVQSGFGHLEPLGHVDFYPNGGSAQPTCGSSTGDVLLQSAWSLISTSNVANAAGSISCNHMSAVYYYTDSINTPSPAFAYPCSDYKSFQQGLCASCGFESDECQRTGYHASPSKTLGTLYLMTLHGVQPPHLGFQYKVTLESNLNDNAKQTRGTIKIKFDEQAEDPLLFNENTLFKRGLINSKTVLIANKPASLNKITISFKKSLSSNFGIGLAGEWRFDSVTVLDMQSHIRLVIEMISMERLIWITKQVNIYGYSILLIAGIIGSIGNLYVFSRKRFRKTPCSHYILIASLFDFFNISFSVSTRLMADGFDFDPFARNSTACRIRTYLAFVFSFCPIGCRCLNIMDRYFCTSRSVFLRNLSSRKLADRLLFVNCLSWILIGIPMLIVFDSIQLNANKMICGTLNKQFTDYFSFFVNPILNFFVPMIIIIVFSISTYRNIQLMNRLSYSRIKQLTLMIIVESCIFVIASVPHGTRFVYIVLTDEIEKDPYRKAQENLFYQISRITFFFNSTFSFYIYFIVGGEIRSTVKNLFKRKQRHIVSPIIITYVAANVNVYRGVLLTPKHIERYQQAQHIFQQWNGLISTTKNPDLAMIYGNTLFIITIDGSNVNGLDISSFSNFPEEEEEVLISRGRTFSVDKVEFNTKDNKYHIHLSMCY